MSKKVLVFSVIGGLIFGAFVTTFFIIKPKSNGLKIQEKSDTPELMSPGISSYEDPSGFSFTVSEDVEISDDTPEDDDSYYSLLTLYFRGEKAEFAAEDTLATTVDGYLKVKNLTTMVTLVGASTLADISAKQYQLNDKILTLAIDQGVVYTFSVPADSEPWEEIQNQVLGSFTFNTPDTASKTSASSQVDTIYEAEEIVE